MILIMNMTMIMVYLKVYFCAKTIGQDLRKKESKAKSARDIIYYHRNIFVM